MKRVLVEASEDLEKQGEKRSADRPGLDKKKKRLPAHPNYSRRSSKAETNDLKRLFAQVSSNFCEESC